MTMFNTSIPTRAASVTPSDSGGTYAIALYVGGDGDVTVVTEGDDTVTFAAVPAGAIIPVRIKQVKSTGTNASDIVRMW